MLTRTIDTQALLENVDLRQVVQTDLGKPRSTGKAHMWRCPFHDEQHGYSLAVYASGWYCFGACGRGGDAISWVREFHHVDFTDACRMLGGEPVLRGKTLKVYRHREVTPAPAQPPTEAWQAEAKEVVARCEWNLWNTTDGQQRALPWLKRRGLLNSTIKAARLGYQPGGIRKWHPYQEFISPCGITIPRYVGDELWGVNVRKAGGEVKYQQFSNANLAAALYWAVGPDNGEWGILPDWPVLFVEGEFDCLIAWQEATEYICPVTLGSKSNALDPRWYPLLWSASAIYICYDNDQAGEMGAARLLGVLPQGQRVNVPTGKDMNDFHLAMPGGVYQWVRSLV